ncbi:MULTISPECIES: hypothetical protein [Streptomyces]|uniref:hypothetical protein n=1 Tax=Streptomyces TaxID=1883 RepID=UPI000C602D48|nr:hypothetical protein [Streptomyces sp. HG99]PIB10977.1 hypothetical protein B1C81_03635 [Streptomyces sp. HG99]
MTELDRVQVGLLAGAPGTEMIPFLLQHRRSDLIDRGHVVLLGGCASCAGDDAREHDGLELLDTGRAGAGVLVGVPRAELLVPAESGVVGGAAQRSGMPCSLCSHTPSLISCSTCSPVHLSVAPRLDAVSIDTAPVPSARLFAAAFASARVCVPMNWARSPA